MAWGDDKFTFSHGAKEEDWNGEDIARKSRGLPLIEWCGDVKDRNAVRVGLENIGGQDQIRTKHLGNDAQGNEGMMRTRGGYPQVTYTKAEEKIPEYRGPGMHGRIEGTLEKSILFIYNDYTDEPTGEVFNLGSNWLATDPADMKECGHTCFVANIDLTTPEDAPWPWKATRVGDEGVSTTFGLYNHTRAVANGGIGRKCWLYQAPSGAKYKMEFSLYWPFVWGDWVIERGEVRNFEVTLTAQKVIDDDGALSPTITTLLNAEPFSFTNTAPIANDGTADPYQYPMVMQTYYSPMVRDGLIPSPTGNEAFFNLPIFFGGTGTPGGSPYTSPTSYYPMFAGKVMRIVITETNLVLSAVMTVDKTEAQCLSIVETYTSGIAYSQNMAWSNAGNPQSYDTTGTIYEIPTKDHHLTADLIVCRGFEPNNSATNTPVTKSFRYTAHFELTVLINTHSGSGSFDAIGGGWYAWSMSESRHYKTRENTKRKLELILDGVSAVVFEDVVADNKVSESNYSYSATCASTQFPHSGSGSHTWSETGGWEGRRLTMNGVVVLDQTAVTGRDYTYTLNQLSVSYPNGSSSPPSCGVVGTPSPPPDTHSGCGFLFSVASAITENVTGFLIEAYMTPGYSETDPNPPPYWDYPPGADVSGKYAVACLGLGHVGSDPATYLTSWRAQKPWVSWNPRRPALWAASGTKKVAWV